MKRVRKNYTLLTHIPPTPIVQQPSKLNNLRTNKNYGTAIHVN
jgi:hypothetical protein